MERLEPNHNNTSNISLLTYNIDGLNPFEIKLRTNEIMGIILSEDPDVIHLQEVVHETGPIITTALQSNGYHMCGVSPADCVNLGNYFTLTFVKNIYSTNVKVSRIQFTGEGRSFQGRDLLQTVFQFRGIELMTLNCHLESTGTAFKSPESFIRMAQLDQAMTRLASHNGPAFVAGDLNIRDSEAKKILEQHNSNKKPVISDAAILIEGPKPSNTWFMPIKNSANMMKCRFDRVFLNDKCSFRPVSVRTVGGDDLFAASELNNGSGCSYTTPSDHRGVAVVFQVTCSDVTDNIRNSSTNHEHIVAIAVSNSTASQNVKTTAKNLSLSERTNSSGRKTKSEVIDLCDSSPDASPAAVSKKRSHHAFSETHTTITSTAAAAMGSSVVSRPVATNAERRQLFLDALDRRQGETK